MPEVAVNARPDLNEVMSQYSVCIVGNKLTSVPVLVRVQHSKTVFIYHITNWQALKLNFKSCQYPLPQLIIRFGLFCEI